MGSVQGLPGTAGAHSTNNHRSDIVHTMGWKYFYFYTWLFVFIVTMVSTTLV